MDHMRDGIYVAPEKIRIILDAAVKDMSLVDLRKSIECYESWLETEEFLLESSPIGWIWKRRLDREFPDKIDTILMIYDAACRELAKRWYEKELEEDETSSNRE